jgi:hypothetical protein
LPPGDNGDRLAGQLGRHGDGVVRAGQTRSDLRSVDRRPFEHRHGAARSTSGSSNLRIVWATGGSGSGDDVEGSP